MKSQYAIHSRLAALPPPGGESEIEVSNGILNEVSVLYSADSVHTQKNLQSTASSLAVKARNAMGTLETGEGNAAECASHKTSRQSWADSAGIKS
ncbi:unnamed protein product [Sphagnum troendelagicum]